MAKNCILVMSGKGGVGKSTVAANLAASLAAKGLNTGILDVDIHGPNIPALFNIEDVKIEQQGATIIPYSYKDNLKVLSIGFMLSNNDHPIAWRGPLKNKIINQFLNQTAWGELDYLIIDCPPGTGDEIISVIQLAGEQPLTAVVVTTPQRLSILDAKKSVNFCKQTKIRILGLIENMSGFACPKCREVTDIFSSNSGEKLAEAMEIKFLGKIPIDPTIVNANEEGKILVECYAQSLASEAIAKITVNLQAELD